MSLGTFIFMQLLQRLSYLEQVAVIVIGTDILSAFLDLLFSL